MALWRSKFLQYCRLAQLVKISAEDINYLYPGRSQQDLADELAGLDVNCFIVTDGPETTRCWQGSGLLAEIEPPAVTVQDTVGAGDSFQAALLSRIQSLGEPLEVIQQLDQKSAADLLRFAATAASLTCTRQGSDLPRLNELPI